MAPPPRRAATRRPEAPIGHRRAAPGHPHHPRRTPRRGHAAPVLRTGLPALGLAATGAALAAAFLNAAFGLCLGCEAYLTIRRLAGRPLAARVAVPPR
ncbi:DUF4395 family protein [Micromonospora sp. WMMA1949]|uniref:DUF4395 family protein n=1 Tax=Micromonospora sp. WMMA1949 TaxID=3015162 RepID=UPI0022B6B7A7|nr:MULTISPECIES: DUF4395 family protein [unclassified Micromonospora]MCZ7429258.1 DUF4395 family protein [Micromonospora sp. WMMA1949]WBC08119.1 DUF4395 family protein [Micromonospora sp. WMMA1947]